MVGTGFKHSLAFGQRPSGAADSEASSQEVVDDVGADEARRARDEDELSVQRVSLCVIVHCDGRNGLTVEYP